MSARELAALRDGIRRARRGAVVRGVVGWVSAAQAMFASFAIGAAAGPVPFRLEELLAYGGALLGGVGVLAHRVARRRLERSAEDRLVVREGARAQRVLVYPDHLVLGEEIIPRAAVRAAEVEASGLVLRYEDPDHGGPVLRELAGGLGTLQRLAQHLAPRAPAP